MLCKNKIIELAENWRSEKLIVANYSNVFVLHEGDIDLTPYAKKGLAR